PDSRPADPMPRVTKDEMYSKCGVSPRRSAPRQMTTSYFFDSASFFDTRGISKEPGTQTTVISSGRAPFLSRASSAPESRRSPMNELKRLITIAKRDPFASRLPWIILAMAPSPAHYRNWIQDKQDRPRCKSLNCVLRISDCGLKESYFVRNETADARRFTQMDR